MECYTVLSISKNSRADDVHEMASTSPQKIIAGFFDWRKKKWYHWMPETIQIEWRTGGNKHELHLLHAAAPAVGGIQ